MEDAIARGCKKIIMGLGGSCTNDAGTGAAAALGVKFFNKNGDSFVPVGGTLCEIMHIDTSNLHKGLKEIELVTMCDIDNPMYGPNGAAAVFGPQKGADPTMVGELDYGLANLCSAIMSDIGCELATVPGGGAAGGMGAGMIAFFGAKLQMGIETVLEAVNFNQLIARADIILTGEGKIDGQSLRGKVVIGVARRAALQNCPVIAVVGGADYDVDAAYNEGVTAIFPINRLPQDLSVSRAHSSENLAFATDNIMRLLKSFS